jgi:rhodanese-related sulfurtransferase
MANNTFTQRRIPLVGEWAKKYGVPSAGGEHAATSGNIEINLNQALQLLDEGALFLDARPVEGYAAGHIPGARSLPREKAENGSDEIFDILNANRKVVTYCQSVQCDESHLLAKALRETGVKEIYVFVGGIDEWKDAGRPVEAGKNNSL